MSTLTEIVRDSVLNSSVPAKKVAEVIKKPYTTMLRELNPEDDGAKLGVDLLEDIIRVTGNTAPLRHLAGQLGYRVVSLRTVTPDKGTFSEELNDDIQALADFQRAMQDDRTVEEVMGLMQKAITEIEEDFVQWRNEKQTNKQAAI